MATQVKDAAWLAWIERLLNEGTTGPSPALFHCQLGGQPDHLAPGSQLSRLAWEDLVGRPLFLHPDCWITRSGELPQDLLALAPHLGNFDLQSPVIWLRSPESQMICPFWITNGLADELERVRGRSPVKSIESASTLRQLAMAGILVSETYIEERQRSWSELVEAARRNFQLKMYTPIRALLHPFHVSALRRYFRYHIRKGGLQLGDDQSPRRFVAHNESVLRFFHHQLTATVSEVAGERVKPSYVYLGAYQGGALLEKHTDREQCDFSLTFCLDYSPEPLMATPWPIQLHPSSGTVTIYQAIGDGLFYRGCKVPHSRAALSDGHSSTSIFFHYVRENFDGPLD